MTGTGTQTDPYLVDNIADFRTACATTDAYVKLVADLDCNKEKYLNWSTLTSNAIEVDFNGYAVKTPYIATGKGMINGQDKTILKNGSILNIYENSASYILKNCSLYNMSISATLYNVTSIPFLCLNNVEKCNFKIFNQNVNKHKAWFTKNLSSGQPQETIVFKDTYFYLEGRVNCHQYGCLIGTDTGTTSYSGYGMMEGCRIEGTLDATSTTYSSMYLSYGIIKNCIFAIDVAPLIKTTDSYVQFINSHSNNVNNLYQSDKVQGAICSGGKTCTDEQIRDPDYLNSIGFFVSEVTS